MSFSERGEYTKGIPSPECMIWKSMRNRCYLPSDTNYKRYGAKGIRVCERWRSFLAFLEDVGRRPSPKHTLDRINGLGNYEPGNVRWATSTEQNRNRSDNRRVTIDGVTRCVSEWAEVSGISQYTINTRLSRNWPIDKLLVKAPSTGRWTGRGVNAE